MISNKIQIHHLKNLRWFLQALSEDAKIQVSLFDEFGKKFETTAEQMVSGYSEAVHFFKSEQLLKDFQIQELLRLDDYFTTISGHENASLWEDEALFNSIEWSYIREYAGRLLMLMEWEKDNLEPMPATYVFIKNDV